MDARNEDTSISTFEPSSDLIQEEDCNTLLLYLPGFTKDQLRVQLTRTRVLKISGARPLTSNRMSSFQKDFPVPENCDTNKISAKFEDGILYVRQPKLATQTQKPVEPQPKIDQPRPPTPPKSSDDHIKQAAAAAAAAAKNAHKKTVESKEKSSGEGDGGRKEEKKAAEEKSDDHRHHKAEAEEKSDDHRRHKAEAEEKSDDHCRHKAAAEKRDKGAGSSVAAAKVGSSDYSKLSPAARLKEMKQKMTNIAVILFVFALGICVSKLPWFSNRAQD